MPESARSSHSRAKSLASFPEPYWSAPNALLYLGDVRSRLRSMPARSVHCCVTSPPYWGLRDYGACPCATARSAYDSPSSTLAGGGSVYGKEPDPHCAKCGGTGRVPGTDGQLGAEPTPDCVGWATGNQCGACFVCHMVEVFREVYRVLRDDGVLWLNLGDTYAGGGGYSAGSPSNLTSLSGANQGQAGRGLYSDRQDVVSKGNLVGVPWRVALALQADGWLLRSDMPWIKRATMPEPVENRPCKALEYVFLLAKGGDYYFDADGVRRTDGRVTRGGPSYGRVSDPNGARSSGAQPPREHGQSGYSSRGFRNSDLWLQSLDTPHGAVGVGDELVGIDVSHCGSRHNHRAHFAVFPPKLIEPLIVAGTGEHGCCARCGRSWERMVSRHGALQQDGSSGVERDRSYRWSRNGVDSTLDSGIARRETVGWQKMCGCHTDEVAPCVVLDPFVGSGTTVALALSLGRAGVGIDLSESYLAGNAVPRIKAVLCAGPAAAGTTAAVPASAPLPPRRLWE